MQHELHGHGQPTWRNGTSTICHGQPRRRRDNRLCDGRRRSPMRSVLVRQQSPPQTRGIASGKKTMAEVMAVEGGHRSERGLAPIMPHRLHSKEGLGELYSSLRAVEAVDGEDENDEQLGDGVRIAKGIAQQASSFGRRRAQRDTTGELARHTSATPP
jgi:hypothetical protein